MRLSGPKAFAIAGAVFARASGRLEDLGGFRAADGLVRIRPLGVELPGRVYAFRSPRSYTRQDVIELHVPGSSVAAAALSAALMDAGARQARPGEFTARAFFSGRIDLSAAEAVADVIDAADDAQLRSAVAALGGRVFRLCESAAMEIADVLAGVEAAIDLAEEDLALDSPAGLAAALASLAGRLDALARDSAGMSETGDRPRVVIAGRPNVGKSSLLNALTHTDRAIVSAIAGTTRDVLGASLDLQEAGTVTLQDAAGFAPAANTLEAAADNAARRAVAAADAILLVVDLAGDRFEQDLELLGDVRSTNRRAPLLLLANKCDLLSPEADASRPREAPRAAALGRLQRSAGLKPMATSAITGEGLAEVRRALDESLNLHAARSGEAIGLHERQKRCLLAAAECCARAGEMLSGAPGVADVAELVAVELRSALAELGAISGQIVTEDILGRIFARFCVGK